MPENEILYKSEDIERIAVIGMAGRFPGAKNIEEFWHNIRNGVESIIQFRDDDLRAYGVPEEWLAAPNFVKSGTILNDVDKFDASFFGYTPMEATHMDPQHRLFLELAWESLENAGYTPDSCENSIGVFAGSSPNDYFSYLSGLYDMADTAGQMELMLGNEKDYLATRVSYKLNLKGPSMTVQTGCSTSLVATQLACQSLLSYQCSLALAGTASVKLIKSKGYFYQDGTIVSPDGHCRAFDAKAGGTVVGQGVAVVVLKRLSEAITDGDHIYAVIHGCAVNNDGGMKIGYTAPSVEGQAEVIAMAHAISDTPADEISYIEAHGTGTKLGDPIEIEALNQAFRTHTTKNQFCAIGSVKTNIGHADITAGLAGLMKTVLMLKHKEIPPSLNYQEHNPEIDFENSCFYVPTQLSEWKAHGETRRAGVSSFGIGGTNVHAVLGEAPHREPSSASRPVQLLLVSARTESALDAACKNLALYIHKHSGLSLSDAAYTLQIGRRTFDHRRVIVCHDRNEAVNKLKGKDPGNVFSGNDPKPNPPVAFMFSGQGSQYAAMGYGLYLTEPVFRMQVDRCFDILSSRYLIDLGGIIFPEKDKHGQAQKQLTQTAIAQPALFVIEYALAKLWMSWGIKPEAMIGHSIGEYVAACLCGLFTLDDALKLIVQRGRLLQSLPTGSMLAVSMAEDDITENLNGDLFLAAVNSPTMCVISGKQEAIDGLHRKLDKLQVGNSMLHTSHAFHSRMVDPIMRAFVELAGEIKFKHLHTPFISNVTGKLISEEDATSPQYWGKHMRQTVRFSDGVKELLKTPGRIMLEVGPGNTLSSLTSQHHEKRRSSVILSSLPHPKDKKTDQDFVLETLGRLWLAGTDINWEKFYKNERRYRIPLPTYPFERKRFWPAKAGGSRLKPVKMGVQASDQDQDAKALDQSTSSNTFVEAGLTRSADGIDDYQAETERTLSQIWKKVLGIKDIGLDDNYFEIGGSSLMAVRVFNQIEKKLGVQLPLATLYEAPTIRSLAQSLSKEGYRPSWASLVKIQAGSNAKPEIFFMHAEGGNVLEYYYLAKHLGAEQSFYGLQAIGLDGKEVVAPSIEEMASSFIKEIKSVQPVGPYYIGGFCLGGIVAFEMAKQLEEMGDEIALLFLISTSTPRHLKVKRNKLGLIKKLYYNILDRAAVELDNLSTRRLKEKVKYLYERMIKTYTVIRFKVQEIRKRVLIKLHIKTGDFSRAYRLEKSVKLSNKAYMSYEPQPYNGKMTLLYVSNRSRLLPEDPYLGWLGLAKKGINLFEVNAFHKNVMLDPHVRQIANILKNMIGSAAIQNENDKQTAKLRAL